MTEFLDEAKLRIKYNRQLEKYKKSKFLIDPIKSAMTYDDLKYKVQESLDKGFRCCYCGRVMTQHSTDKPHWRDAYAIDHINPSAMVGYNSIENINICCHRCNIIKGTMDVDVFMTNIIQPLMKKSAAEREYNLNQMFIGKEAKEINRYQQQEKESKKKQLRLSSF